MKTRQEITEKIVELAAREYELEDLDPESTALVQVRAELGILEWVIALPPYPGTN
jgi:hypothetical protein